MSLISLLSSHPRVELGGLLEVVWEQEAGQVCSQPGGKCSGDFCQLKAERYRGAGGRRLQKGE